MQYLTVEQSLADIATFIHFLQSNPEIGSDVKVILWGSGYGGTMATWARKRYPHLVDGVIFVFFLNYFFIYATLSKFLF